MTFTFIVYNTILHFGLKMTTYLTLSSVLEWLISLHLQSLWTLVEENPSNNEVLVVMN